jgi:ABC-2 type transport system ATP-binding protein
MISFHHVSKTFGSVVALDNLSLDIREGEIFGLLGPNGAGKTTSVNIAVGLLKPDSGSVDLDGLGPPTRPETRARIGVAPQALAIYENLSARENLAFFGKISGISGRPLRDRIAWALDFVGLAERAGHRVRTYSGGMKRRLNLAVALIHDPPLLLLDEPTAGVDPQSRNAIFEKVKAMRKEGRTIVYTTHYMEEAQRLCDRVGIIDHGRLLALDTVDGLISAHGGKALIVAEREDGEIRIETDDPLRELATLHRGGLILRLRVDRPDLESVFLKLTGRHLRDN